MKAKRSGRSPLRLVIDATNVGTKVTGMERYLQVLIAGLCEARFQSFAVATSRTSCLANVGGRVIAGPRSRELAQQIWLPSLVRGLRPKLVLEASVGGLLTNADQ